MANYVKWVGTLTALLLVAFFGPTAALAQAVAAAPGDLKGSVFYVINEEKAGSYEPVIYKYDLESAAEYKVGCLPMPLLNHIGLSISSDGEKVVGCAAVFDDESGTHRLGIYTMERNGLGGYKLTAAVDYYELPPYPYKGVYDEWGDALYVTCHEPLPLEKGEGAIFGLQSFKIKATLAVVHLSTGLVEDYDITDEGYHVGVSSVTERVIYVGTASNLRFFKRGEPIYIKGKKLSEYFDSGSFPLILSGEGGFVVAVTPGDKDAFLLHYVSFAHPPNGNLGEAEFVIPKREKGYAPFYQLTNTVSPYSGQCLITKHYKDFEREDTSLCWELVALDTATWETTSIVNKYGEDYAIHNPPFVFGWIAPELETGNGTAHGYVYNNNFMYRPWSLRDE